MRASSYLLSGLLLISGWMSCGAPPEGGSVPLSEERKAQLRALAHDYQFKAVTEEESAAIFAQIRGLDEAGSDEFRRCLTENAGYTGREAILSNIFHEIAKERGISFLDLRPEDEEIKAEAATRFKAALKDAGAAAEGPDSTTSRGVQPRAPLK